MTLAERKQNDPEFVKEFIEPIKQESKEAQKRKPKSVVKNSSQQNDKSRTKVARVHGTNATSVSACAKILAEHPELVDDIKSGKKSVTMSRIQFQGGMSAADGNGPGQDVVS